MDRALRIAAVCLGWACLCPVLWLQTSFRHGSLSSGFLIVFAAAAIGAFVVVFGKGDFLMRLYPWIFYTALLFICFVAIFAFVFLVVGMGTDAYM